MSIHYMRSDVSPVSKSHVPGFIIAIDGPSGAGKGTIAPTIAEKLHGFYFYTGAMYRCLALLVINNDIAFSDEKHVEELIASMQLTFNDNTIILNGQDITERIKHEDTAMGASLVASFGGVRDKMIKMQQRIGKEKITKGEIVIAEGRNTANAVFPTASFKLFLTATPEIRATRRFAQIKKRGEEATYEQVLQDIQKRDYQDIHRSMHPLSHDPVKEGYFVLDNSLLTEKETVGVIMGELKKRGLVNTN